MEFEKNIGFPEPIQAEGENGRETNFEKIRWQKIENILDKHSLIVSEEGKADLEKEIQKKDVRFFHVRAINEQGEEKFVKIFANDGNSDVQALLLREMAVRQALNNQISEGKAKNYFKKSLFDSGNLRPEQGAVYFVADSFVEQAEIGFADNDSRIEKLNRNQAGKCVKKLFALQEEIDGNRLVEDVKQMFGFSDDQEIYKRLEDIYEDYDGYQENVLKIMSMFDPEVDQETSEEEKIRLIAESRENYGRPVDLEELRVDLSAEYQEQLEEVGSEKMPVWMILEKRLQTSEFRDKVRKLLARFEQVMTDSKYQTQDYQLVHGDLSPKNTFYYDDGEIEFVDWEYGGVTKNKLLALIHDYGAMRSDAWNNREYREGMDDAIIEHFRERGDEEAGKAVVALAIFRSHCCLAGFLENYDISKQRLTRELLRKESTEADIKKAFVLAGIEL